MGETRSCFKFVFSLTKFLGGFPVSEYANKNIFEWYSFKTFCFFIFLLLNIIHFLLNIYENILEYVLIVFIASGMAVQISFLMIAMQWPDLGKECDRIDFYMKDYGFPKNIKLKLRVICVILMALSLAIYALFDIGLSRNPTFGAYTFIGIWRALVNQDKFPEMGCKLLFTFVRKLSHWQVTIMRCCADIFIITLSVILAMRFRQIADRVYLLIQRKIRDENIWMQTREDYQRLFMFWEKWDDVLGYLVLTSFMSNIYGLLLNIHGALTVSETMDRLYTTLATAENLFRCVIICYTAGNVYEESRGIVRLLILTPSDVFNVEIERMILQIRQTQPALTGKQLFTVKHSLILQILGGIAVHEIVLLQYYSPHTH